MSISIPKVNELSGVCSIYSNIWTKRVHIEKELDRLTTEEKLEMYKNIIKGMELYILDVRTHSIVRVSVTQDLFSRITMFTY